MSKYLNIRQNGCDSKKEAARKKELLLREKAGEIRDLQCQVKYELVPSQQLNGRVVERSVCYILDFQYFDLALDGMVYEDVKAFDKKRGKWLITPEYVIKRKLMLFKLGIRITQV